MKNYELLDMIGDVNEEYVQSAASNVVRPRFRWKAIAACAALVLGLSLLPSLTAEGPGPAPEATRGPGENLVQHPGLHSYLLVEEDRRIMTTQGEVKAPEGGADVPGGGSTSGEPPTAPAQGFAAPVPAPENGGDVPVQEAAYYYERLMQGMGVSTDGNPAVYPDWFGGAWLDGDQGELLAVSIVETERTPELEEQVRRWAGGPVVFHSVKYSKNDLSSLMDRISQVFEELDCRVFLSYGVYESDNCIHLDFSEVPGDEVLAALAQLDPDGDAIFIQVFTGRRNILTDTSEVVCDPSRSEPVPGGATQPAVNGLPGAKKGSNPTYTENGRPAQYDILTGADE